MALRVNLALPKNSPLNNSQLPWRPLPRCFFAGIAW
jgi:hypothetical protein